MKYRTIVADPPWDTRLRGTGSIRPPRGAHRHYDLMPLGAITRLAVEEHADPSGCVLFLWTTSRALWEGDAYLVCCGWHFEPRSLHTWVKPRIGLGWFGRSNTEHFIVATRGRADVNFRSTPTAHKWPARAHSEKPDEFYEWAMEVTQGPYLDLFARCQRLGWDTWGNEALNHVEMST